MKMDYACVSLGSDVDHDDGEHYGGHHGGHCGDYHCGRDDGDHGSNEYHDLDEQLLLNDVGQHFT